MIVLSKLKRKQKATELINRIIQIDIFKDEVDQPAFNLNITEHYR